MAYLPNPNPMPITGAISATQGTSPWVTTATISGLSSVTGTVFATLAGTSVVAGVVSATQGTSPWIVAGAVSSTQGTNPWIVAGTVSATQGTSPWVTTATISGNPLVWIEGHAGGIVDAVTTTTTAPANGVAVLGVYPGPVLPILTTAQSIAIQLDASGRQVISGSVGLTATAVTIPAVFGVVSATQGTSPWIVAGAVSSTQGTNPWIVAGAVSSTQGTVPWSANETQFAGVALGATAVTNYGSIPNSAIVPGVNAFITNAPIVTASIFGHTGGIIDAVTTTTTAPANGIATLGQYNTTAPTLTAAQSVMVQSNVKGSVLVSTEGAKATYRSTAVASPSLASALFPTVVLPGSSSKVVKITAVHIALSTAAATSCLLIATVSTSAWTGGTSSATNKGPLDIADPAPSAAPIQYSVVATGGGAIATYPIYKNLITSGVTTVLQSGDAAYDEVFGNNSGAKPITLRGPANAFNVFTSVAVNLYCVLEWTEE